MEIIFLIAGLALGYLIAFLIHKVLPGQKTSMSHVPKTELEAAENRWRESEQQRQALLFEQKRDQEAMGKLETLLADKEADFRNTADRLAAALEKIRNLEEDLKEGQTQQNQLLKQNRSDFENLARKLLEENSRKFSESNREKLDEVLKPFQTRIQEFRERVETTHRQQDERFVEFKTDLKNLRELNQQISQEANALANALRGESKTQGIWGEMLLEKILEKSGLTPGEEYTTQESYTAEIDGQARRVLPDVVIHLPDQRHVVIDSKVSLKAFTDYVNAEDDSEAEVAAKAHVLSVTNHVKGITAKNYQDAHGLSSLDFILVFIPVEAAFNLALARDTALYDTAFERNIVLVTPSTLLATLRVVENLWRQEKQNHNALRIAQEAGKLYDKFIGFLDDMHQINQRLDQARVAYDAAENKLKSGRGNLIGRAEKLKELGARSAKTMPNAFQIDDGRENEDEPR